jgi:hypothetical protein
MHLLQMAMAGLPTLLGVRVAILNGGRCACECVASVLLEKLLASNVRVWCDEEEKKMREAGGILILPEGEEFFCLVAIQTLHQHSVLPRRAGACDSHATPPGR